MRFKAILFDWDGTLFDSIRYALTVYQRLFKSLGLHEDTWKKFREEFKADYHKYYESKGIPRSAFKEVDREWMRLYESGSRELKLIHGTKGLLSLLKRKKIKIAMVSNGSKGRILDELKKHGIRSYFSAVVTGDDIPEFKPSPKGIIYALGELRVRPKDALYVGDMADDIIAGRRAGVKTAAVATGIHTVKRLLKEKPDYLMKDARGVFQLLS